MSKTCKCTQLEYFQGEDFQDDLNRAPGIKLTDEGHVLIKYEKTDKNGPMRWCEEKKYKNGSISWSYTDDEGIKRMCIRNLTYIDSVYIDSFDGWLDIKCKE